MTETDRIHALWDELAEFGASRPEEALDHLLACVCDLVDAQNAMWVGAVRMSKTQPRDPVHGWRARAVHHLHASPPVLARTQEQVRNLDRGTVDETTVRNVALAGTFRVHRLVDLVGEAWFGSDYYEHFYRRQGKADAIWAGLPVNTDAEVYVGVFRDATRPRFSPEDRERVAAALRGLKWFHRSQMLARGLLVARAPLTPAERGVLRELLTGRSEKQIAASLGKSPNTTHEYVTSVFRKFGVNNRAALMALWLGRSESRPPD